jgi:hypothetical protein
MHYRRLPSWDSWRLPRPSALPRLDERARLAALLDDVDGATVAYRRLLAWADYFAASGSGKTTFAGSVHLSLGMLAATLGKPDRATCAPRSRPTSAPVCRRSRRGPGSSWPGC